MNTLRIVRFSNGMYGIRKGIIYYQYKDLSVDRCWWFKGSRYFRDCVGCAEKVKKAWKDMVRGEEVLDIKKFLRGEINDNPT